MSKIRRALGIGSSRWLTRLGGLGASAVVLTAVTFGGASVASAVPGTTNSPTPAATPTVVSTTAPSTLRLEGAATVAQGTKLTFDYSTPVATVTTKNWVGIYPASATPGQQASTTYQYVPDAHGTVTFETSQLAGGDWKAYYLYNDAYTVLSGPVSFTVTAAAVPPAQPLPPVSTGTNLLVNAGAETGEGSLIGVDTNTVPGWTQTGLLNAVTYGAKGGNGVTGYPSMSTPGPTERGQNFFSGGGGGISTGTQTASVKAASASIDRGRVSYDLSGWLGGTGSETDAASVTSTFLDANGGRLGAATLRAVTPAMRKNTTELVSEQATGQVPAGTRMIRTVLTIVGPHPTDRGGHGQGYADDLALRISATVPSPGPAAIPAAHVPGYDHVFVVMLENQDYAGIIGNKTDAPYLNSLRPKGANLTQAYGETHPSDPNYVALAGGSLFGVNSNSPFTSTVNAPHLGDLVTQTGGRWRGYMENAAGACDTTAHGAYTIDDLPFYFFNDIKSNPAACQQHLVPLTTMSQDLERTSTTPTFAWLSADDCDDMEGCGIKAGDTWLSHTLPTIFNSPAWRTQRSLLIVTFDEDTADGQAQSQRIPTLILGSQGVQAGSSSNIRYTHYNVLRTIEAALGLPPLTKNDEYATPINDIWTRKR